MSTATTPDDAWVQDDAEVERIAAAIEARRIELGKDSGFERMYPPGHEAVLRGMARHLVSLSRVLKPGARLAYVVARRPAGATKPPI